MSDSTNHNFGKWHFTALIILLYTLVVMVAMFTNQPPEAMSVILKEGSGGVGILVVAILFFAE